jgi:IS30 family transposase
MIKKCIKINLIILTSFEVYLFELHSLWQSESNISVNALERQYKPKGTDLSVYSQEEMDTITEKINNHLLKDLRFDYRCLFTMNSFQTSSNIPRLFTEIKGVAIHF